MAPLKKLSAADERAYDAAFKRAQTLAEADAAVDFELHLVDGRGNKDPLEVRCAFLACGCSVDEICRDYELGKALYTVSGTAPLGAPQLDAVVECLEYSQVDVVGKTIKA